MGKHSEIGWTDATWNPWYGCHKISPACAYCYAEQWAQRSGRDFETVTRAKDATFYAPLKWKEPRRIFTCSLSDFFIEEADWWRHEAFDVMARTPQHIYQILTKRPERAETYSWSWAKRIGSHVCLMTTVENQRMADERIPKLLEIPARWHGVSVEPLLGPVDLRPEWMPQETSQFISSDWEKYLDARRLDWVIVGGESGGPEERRLVMRGEVRDTVEGEWRPGFIPKLYAEAWVRSLRDQCVQAGVPFFFKQWGGPKPTSGGRMLDGREWNEMPEFFYAARNSNQAADLQEPDQDS